jgi:hypothetical protein
LEQKKVEKDRLRQELGSEYESSEDSMDWEELGINKSELDKYMKNTKEKEEDKDQPESGEQLDSDEVEKYEFKFYNFFRSKSHSKEEEVGGINGKAKPKLG